MKKLYKRILPTLTATLITLSTIIGTPLTEQLNNNLLATKQLTDCTVNQLSVLNQHTLNMHDECGYFALYNAYSVLQAYNQTDNATLKSLNSPSDFKSFYHKAQSILHEIGLGNSSDLSFLDLDILLQSHLFESYTNNMQLICIPDIYLITQNDYSDPLSTEQIMQTRTALDNFSKQKDGIIACVLSKPGHYYTLIGIKENNNVDVYVADSQNSPTIIQTEEPIITMITQALTGKENFSRSYLSKAIERFVKTLNTTEDKEEINNLLGRFKGSTFKSLETIQCPVFLHFQNREEVTCRLKNSIQRIKTTINLEPENKELYDLLARKEKLEDQPYDEAIKKKLEFIKEAIINLHVDEKTLSKEMNTVRLNNRIRILENLARRLEIFEGILGTTVRITLLAIFIAKIK